MKNSWPLADVPIALPRQMNQVRGQFSGASGSSIENSRSPDFRRSTIWSTTSSSVPAPLERALRTTSIGFSLNCGKNGSQPWRTARA